MLNLSILLEDSARRYPSKPAFSFMDGQHTFEQINAMANRIANGLQAQGISKGDKVALSCLNLPYFPMAYFGILKTGATVVPLSVLLKKDEIKFHLNDSQAKAYLCFSGTQELPMGEMGYAAWNEAPECEKFFMIMPRLEDKSPHKEIMSLGQLIDGQDQVYKSCDTAADDTAVIVYTSGTTGRPKGAELSHNNLFTNAVLSSNITSLTHADTQLIVLPLFHIFAMTVLMNAGVYKGAHSVLIPRFDAETVLSTLHQRRITVFAGVPTMYWAMVNQSENFADIKAISKHLRICVSGGASLPLQVLKDFEEKFEVPIMEGYGMSEGSPVVTFNQLDIGRKPGSIGTPVWGVEVKIVDHAGEEVPTGEKGELLYRGPNVMKGYYKRDEANAEILRGGWMHSGDVAMKDEDGFFFIVDRTKDMILRGGLNVYPREVEEVIMKHPAVSLVAVIGVPDEALGEEIKACIVLKSGTQVSTEEIKSWTEERIAAYKYPRIVEFMDALPMSATGKILKKELRKQVKV